MFFLCTQAIPASPRAKLFGFRSPVSSPGPSTVSASPSKVRIPEIFFKRNRCKSADEKVKPEQLPTPDENQLNTLSWDPCCPCCPWFSIRKRKQISPMPESV